MSEGEALKVFVRVRGMNSLENSSTCSKIIDVDKENSRVIVQGKRSFNYTGVWGEDSKQEDIFNDTIKGQIESVVEGYHATIFAYGQTSSGKTYTLIGENVKGAIMKGETEGIAPRAIRYLYQCIDAKLHGDPAPSTPSTPSTPFTNASQGEEDAPKSTSQHLDGEGDQGKEQIMVEEGEIGTGIVGNKESIHNTGNTIENNLENKENTTENAENTQTENTKTENTENTKNTEKTEKTENTKNSGKTGNTENTKNSGKTGNTENTENTKNTIENKEAIMITVQDIL